MQFPVPQFTEVEDKIIGSLTLKQFGIIFAAGVVIFLAYSVTKSILVAIFIFMLVGVPALGLAFAKINGRPLYNTIALFAKFLSSPKVLVFHKEVYTAASTSTISDAETKSQTQTPQQTPEETQAELKKIRDLLKTTASQEQETAQKLK